MLKDLFDRGKCALGFHAGEWRYLREGSCQQTRVCSRCKAESQQLVHTWQTWDYQNADACLMVRECGRCGEKETKTEHVWGTPVYQSEGSCALIRPCSRCGETKAAGTAHVWESWNYDGEQACSQVIACSRCGDTGSQRRITHEWGAWYQSQFYDTGVRVCRRCAEMVFDSEEGNKSDKVSLQMVDRAVWNVMESKDNATVRERVTQHSQVLFDPVAEKYFKFAIDQRAPDESAKDTLRQLAGLLERCRTQGIDAVFSPPVKAANPAPVSTTGTAVSSSIPASKELDGRLVGHWRSTEIFPSSGGFSMSTDTHCVLDAGGRFEWWSYSVSSLGSRPSEPEYGDWSVSNNILLLDFDGGNRLERKHVIQGPAMLWPDDRRWRIWERIN